MIRHCKRLAAALLVLAATVASPAYADSTSAFVNRLYNTPAPSVPQTANPAVGTSATSVAPADPGRYQLLVFNLSANACYIAPTGSVSSTNGSLLAPSGGFFITTARDDLTLPTFQWWVVCAASSSQLYVQSTDLQ